MFPVINLIRVQQLGWIFKFCKRKNMLHRELHNHWLFIAFILSYLNCKYTQCGGGGEMKVWFLTTNNSTLGLFFFALCCVNKEKTQNCIKDCEGGYSWKNFSLRLELAELPLFPTVCVQFLWKFLSHRINNVYEIFQSRNISK